MITPSERNNPVDSGQIVPKNPVMMLFSRLVLFALFQALIALVLNSWRESEKYWLLTATLTNIISVVLLIALFRQEGTKYLSIFRFTKEWKQDLKIFIGLALLSMPMVLVPSLVLSTWLWGNVTYYHQVLFQPIPVYLVYVLLVAFPVTIGFAELATYFGYIMPRLKRNVHPQWLAFVLPVFFLSIQHCTLPLLFETKFILFRGLMYLPFSLMLGIALYKRPSLLPFLAILHGLMDALAAMMLLSATLKV